MINGRVDGFGPFVIARRTLVIHALKHQPCATKRTAMTKSDSMLQVRNLAKTYPGGVHALAGIDLDIPSGMFGLLGPNGAGKTSLMRVLAGLMLPDVGTVNFDGIDVLARPFDLRLRLGYLPQSFGAYPYIGCRALLWHMAVLKGLPDSATTARQVDHLLEITNLERHASRPVTAFSGGMRQRFGIAQALLGDPALLILDEPTAGLDPEERLRLYNLLSRLSADRVVLLSTHIVDDVEQLCPDVAIIDAGRIVVQGQTDRVVGSLKGQIWQSAQMVGPEVGAITLSTAYHRGTPLHRYHCHDCPGEGFGPVPPSLQDCYFLALAQRETAPC